MSHVLAEDKLGIFVTLVKAIYDLKHEDLNKHDRATALREVTDQFAIDFPSHWNQEEVVPTDNSVSLVSNSAELHALTMESALSEFGSIFRRLHGKRGNRSSTESVIEDAYSLSYQTVRDPFVGLEIMESCEITVMLDMPEYFELNRAP